VKSAIWLVVAMGCAGGGSSPSGDTAADEPAICVGAPVVTWDNFGAGFVTQYCDACHASTTLDRHDAPDDVTFDTEDEIWSHADRILVRAAGDAPTMPPMGGVPDDDRTLLEIWLTCDR